MKLVTAIVRTTSLQHVVQHLEKIGIKGLTISEIKGLGEEVRLNNPYSIHDRIEIVVADEKTDEAARAILEDARTGLAGDGIIAVAPLDFALKIRTQERMT